MTESRHFMDGRTLVADFDIRPSGVVYRNADVNSLYQAAIQTGQAKRLHNGALVQDTTPYFGRAAKSSFYVNDPNVQFQGKSLDDLMAWGNPDANEFDNLPIAPEVYTRLRQRVTEHLSSAGDLYVNDAWSGRTETSRIGVRVITARPASALFARNIFLRLQDDELGRFRPDWTILHAPDVCAEPSDGTNGDAFIITDLSGGVTIIGGTRYHGQIKKSIFSVQNFRLPLRGILTMHAGASEGNGGLSAIHAGLSGTGKTTLSNTGFPVADDQIVVDIHSTDHNAVVSNMEGGQYAKTENLRRDKEPETFDAIKHGTTAENIAHDADGIVDYADSSITANGRVGYPLEYVPTAKETGTTQAPSNITFLTADGFGVLPPVARLSAAGGMFHFACGFTSKMPGTEKGINEPLPTFSSFFGKPFMPLKPIYYMDLLNELIETHGTELWLVNTGWLGANAPGRKRVDILVSKAIINAVRDNQIDMNDDNFWYDPVFRMQVPKTVPGVDSAILDPKNAWNDQGAYRDNANKLADIFSRAVGQLQGIPAHVVEAGPKALAL
ncbi:MAG: phosphoenolpyruvate carboxykinase (ATP) [Myxococcales bacterium]|nr:phosphoenolpyruvate carboxykinase (ATP) [Myxococcales bacterium]